MTSTTKGYLYAFISTLSLSHVYIFSKAALNLSTLAQFGFYWFGFGIMWNLIFSLLTGKFRTIKGPSAFQWYNLFGIAAMEILATVAFFIGIQIIPNPSIPSLVRNLEPVVIVLLAIFILKEQHRATEKLGVLVTILGTTLVSLNKGSSWEQLWVPGIQYIIISCFFYAFRSIWSKKVIQHFTPQALNLNKVVALFGTASLAILLQKETLLIPQKAFSNIFIGSLIGPFFTSYIQFASFKHIDVSRSTMVQSITGLITVVLAYVYFGHLPYLYQIVGGLISIAGLFLVTRRELFRPNAPHSKG